MNQIQRTNSQMKKRTEIGTHLLESGQIAESTIAIYKAHFEEYVKFCGSLRTASNPAFLPMWRNDLLKTGYTDPTGQPRDYSPQAITTRLSAVKKVMAAARERGLIDRTTLAEFNDVRGVSPKAMKGRNSKTKAKNAISAAKVREMIDSIEIKRTENVMHRAMFLTLYTVGCRVEELRQMKFADIEQHTSGNYIVYIAGKNKVEPTPRALSKEAYQSIQEWKKTLEEEHEYIFINSKGNPISATRIGQLCKQHGTKVGIPTLTPHDARRFNLTALVDTDLAAAQQQAGHAKIDTTLQYDTKIRTAGVTENLF